ncbi:hypothetical protein BU795_17855 [Salmonella enterica]|nr:hypothetical protein [Salmonella enterica]
MAHVVFLCRSAPVRFRKIRDCLFSDLRGKKEKVYVLTILYVLAVLYVLSVSYCIFCIVPYRLYCVFFIHKIH